MTTDQPAGCPQHVSWCTGSHDVYDECQHQRNDPDDTTTVEVLAVPCSHANLSVNALIVDRAGYDWLIAELAKALPLLEAGAAESICTHES